MFFISYQGINLFLINFYNKKWIDYGTSSWLSVFIISIIISMVCSYYIHYNIHGMFFVWKILGRKLLSIYSTIHPSKEFSNITIRTICVLNYLSTYHIYILNYQSIYLSIYIPYVNSKFINICHFSDKEM